MKWCAIEMTCWWNDALLEGCIGERMCQQNSALMKLCIDEMMKWHVHEMTSL
jgi:hypothetical protein